MRKKKKLEKSDLIRGRKGPGVGYTKRKFPPGIDRDVDGVVKERRPKASFSYKKATKADQEFSRKNLKSRSRKR